jgi:hypothetical protein
MADAPAQTNSHTERNEAGGKPHAAVDHRRVVYRNVHNLRVRRSDLNNAASLVILHDDLLLRAAAQCSGAVGQLAQTLHRIHYRIWVRLECRSDRGVVVDILRHHREHLGKLDQRNECRIEALRLRRVGESVAAEPRILLQPVLGVENLLRIGASAGDLCQQRIRIERDRSKQLVEFVCRRNVRLRVERGRRR